MLTTVHLLRHGEVHNPDGVLYGRLPGYRLSERGHAMARRVAEHLSDGPGPQARPRRVVAVISSPLERAQQTARPVAEVFGLEVETDDRLIEATNHFEGLTFGVGDGSLRRPSHWRHLWNPWRPSWGEPYRQQADRMLAAVADARDRAHRAAQEVEDPRDTEVVLVSHQLPIWVTRLALERRPFFHDPRRRECSLASLTTLRYDGDQLLDVRLHEPAADLLPGASTVAGA